MSLSSVNRGKTRKGFRARAGFTLIELLVVIAIIAILAAIIFPVFAQAREKARQTTCLSNMKQIGLGILQYVQDFNETYPIAQPVNSVDGFEAVFYNISVPAGWDTGKNVYWYESDKSVWPNAAQPYIKSYAVFACPSADIQELYPTPSLPVLGEPAKISYTFNAQLNTAPESLVKQASLLPLVYEGNGKAGLNGYYFAKDFLNCPDAMQPCVFKSTSPENTCTGENGDASRALAWNNLKKMVTQATMWIHSSGANSVYADGHAKWTRMGAQVEPQYNTNYYYDPFAIYSKQGIPKPDANGPINYSAESDGCHFIVFSPDREK